MATRREKLQWLREAEANGHVADSHEVRLQLMSQVHEGTLALEEAQSILKDIKRNAKKNKQVTRNEAYNGELP